MPEHGAKPAGVIETEFCVVIESEGEMFMFFQWLVMRADTEAAGHSEVEDEGAGTADDKQVFSPSFDRGDLMVEETKDIIFDGPAHTSVVNLYIAHGVID